MAKIRLSDSAESDLIDIDEYSYEFFGDEVAASYSRGFRDSFDLLRRHPFVGEEKPELGRGVRCLVHRKHRIFYLCTDETVFIIRIIHHAQDAKRALN